MFHVNSTQVPLKLKVRTEKGVQLICSLFSQLLLKQLFVLYSLREMLITFYLFQLPSYSDDILSLSRFTFLLRSVFWKFSSCSGKFHLFIPQTSGSRVSWFISVKWKKIWRRNHCLKNALISLKTWK